MSFKSYFSRLDATESWNRMHLEFLACYLGIILLPLIRQRLLTKSSVVRKPFSILNEGRRYQIWDESEDGSETASPSPFHFSPLSTTILIEPMLTMFADILYLTHHLLHKLFYKQIIATAVSSRVFRLLVRAAVYNVGNIPDVDDCDPTAAIKSSM